MGFDWVKHTRIEIKANQGEGGGVFGVGNYHPSGVFLSFFLDDKISALDVFSSWSFIPRTHFETSLVMVSYFGYEI